MQRSHYDPSFCAGDDSLWRRWACPICQNLIHRLVETKCGHLFCENCLTEAVSKKAECPCCRATLADSGGWHASPSRDREIGQLAVRCDFGSCTWTGTQNKLAAHREECRFHWVKCEHCVFVFAREEWFLHLQRCEKKPFPCEVCGLALPENQHAAHSPVCYRRQVVCPLSCVIAPFPFSSLWHHLQEKCPKRRLHCEFAWCGCTFTGLAHQVEEHNPTAVQNHLNLLLRHLMTERDRKDARRTGRGTQDTQAFSSTTGSSLSSSSSSHTAVTDLALSLQHSQPTLSLRRKTTSKHKGHYVQVKMDPKFYASLSLGDILDAWDGKGWYLARIIEENVSSVNAPFVAGSPSSASSSASSQPSDNFMGQSVSGMAAFSVASSVIASFMGESIGAVAAFPRAATSSATPSNALPSTPSPMTSTSATASSTVSQTASSSANLPIRRVSLASGSSLIRIHFLGWGARYDRVLPRNSVQLAAVRTHSGPSERTLLERGEIPNEQEIFPFLDLVSPQPSYWSCCGCTTQSSTACPISDLVERI